MFVEEYENPDGTRTLKQSSQPLNVQTERGLWVPVDTSLRADQASGRTRTGRHPLNPSFAANAADSAVVKVDVWGKSVALGMERAADKPVRAEGANAEYLDVLPDTDLKYEVTPGSVKETIVLRRPPATASWRFTLDTKGLTPRLAEGGVVELVDTAGDVLIVMPPVEAWDSAPEERRTLAGGSYGLEKRGQRWILTVSVDEEWLRAPERVYPVSVDPTFQLGVTDSRVYRSDGYTCQNCGIKFGNSLANGDSINRTVFKFDYSPLFGKNVVSARIDMARIGTEGFFRAWNANLYHATSLSYSGIGQHLATAVVGDVGQFSDSRLSTFLRNEVNASRNTAYFMVRGTEQTGTYTYKNMSATMLVDTGSAPPVPTQTAPADHAVLSTLTPTLSVNPVTDPDGDAVKYCFTVATGSDGKSGMVVDSGCQTSTSWTIPEGVLTDGAAYTWLASSYSGSTLTQGTTVRHFKVDQRIGDRGPSPVDSMGPVEVNLANGNLTTSASSPTFTTVGGTAGLTLTYNSQQPEIKGLKASYFDDPSHAGLINDAIQKPVLVRHEPQVNVDWGAASPHPPALGPDWWLVRWEGYFVPPVTGTYQFAGVHDDGPVIWINNNIVYDVANTRSSPDWTQSTGVALTAGQAVPIKIELQEMAGNARMKLYTRTTAGASVPSQIVPSDWLTTVESPSLPKGWTLSADLDGSGAVYTEAKVVDQTIVITDATGAKHTWTKKSTGGYAPPEDEDGVLAFDTTGRITLTEGSDVYVFHTDGKLDSLSSVLDSRKPAALQNIYSGTPSRLTQIKDPVSGRAHTLTYNRPGENCYGATPVPPGFDALPPVRMLCRITYWDGTETRYWYTQGRLARIEDPGSELTDYAYDAAGLLTGVRDNLGADWVAANPTTNPAADATTLISYTTVNGKPAVTAISSPVPTPGQDRPQRGYRYEPANRTTYVDVAGLTPASGFYSKITYDASDRLLTTTDATGRTTSQTWSVKDQQLTSTDAAGRVSTTVYDAQDRPTDKYGPGPASCFAGQTPTAACAETVPHTRTAYDEGINGLAASLYANKTLTGMPKVHQTGLGLADGRIRSDWTSTQSPDPDIPAATFSIRLTGQITFPVAGTYTLETHVDDGVRLFIDDKLIAESWIPGAARPISGTFTATAGATHRIRIDYYNDRGAGQLHLNWRKPPSGTYEAIPGQYLKPGYGLTTSSTEFESDGVPNQVGTTDYTGLDPIFGLATTTTTGGLSTTSTHEPPATGYLRATARTLPAGTQTTYQYYGDTEARTNPCVPGSPAINQGGLAKLTTHPTPANGPARVDEQVYDASGRVIAESVAGDWTCITYDARDRVVQTVYPASAAAGVRTVTTDHSVGGDPLTTSITDHNGSVTTTVDLLGRVVSYTDIHGVRTDTTFDRVGRVIEEKVDLPHSADSVQVMTFTYDDAGRVLTTSLGATVLATVSYDDAGELFAAAYSNGTGLASITKDGNGQVTSVTWRLSNGQDIVSALSRSRAGTIIDESLGGADARPEGPNYTYDDAGRLTQSWTGGHHRTYDYTSAAPSGCPTGSRTNSGTNTNRVRLVDVTSAATVETGYCYDDADRLLTTTGGTPETAVSAIEYDDHGNTLQYTIGGSTTHLGWDGTDRNVSAATVGLDPVAVNYGRDATNRLIRRTVVDAASDEVVLYGYTTEGDNADFALAEDKKVLSRTIQLPGGVIQTIDGGGDAVDPTWDHPTVRGDLSLTTDPAGLQAGGLRTFGAFGEPLGGGGTTDPDNVPDNQPGEMDFGWLGQHLRPYEHGGALSLVQMGARPYSPLTGRFLSVDPEEGGSSNDYEYTAGNPINTTDLDGRAIWVPLIAACVRWCARAYRAVRSFRSVGGRFRTGGVFQRLKNCLRNSFTPDTPVLMGDGTYQPIADIEVGDVVLVTDPATGMTRGEPVTHVIAGQGQKVIVDVGIDTDDDGVSDDVKATDGHPFYVIGQGWTDAQDLQVGDGLRTPTGTAVITRIAVHTANTSVRNLSVGVTHTYYVGVDNQAVLVHNCRQPRGHKTKTYKTRKAAYGAAKRVAKRSRCGTFRGFCSSRDHYHVDFRNGAVIHFRWRHPS
ncbi:Cell wall-associated polypeptide [Actinokineospora sp. UTMC 2448]|nr:Cell wall-associated polypeptide [Actinokineospora sp. UTMC 2448]